MSTPSIDERRKIAGLLRGMSGDTAGLSDGEFIDLVEEIVRGVDVPASQDPDAAFLNRLADLIDPTAHECTVADNLALIERNRELECELASCKAKLGRVSRIADFCHARAIEELEAWGNMPVPHWSVAVIRVFAEVSGKLRKAIK